METVKGYMSRERFFIDRQLKQYKGRLFLGGAALLFEIFLILPIDEYVYFIFVIVGFAMFAYSFVSLNRHSKSLDLYSQELLSLLEKRSNQMMGRS